MSKAVKLPIFMWKGCKTAHFYVASFSTSREKKPIPDIYKFQQRRMTKYFYQQITHLDFYKNNLIYGGIFVASVMVEYNCLCIIFIQII